MKKVMLCMVACVALFFASCEPRIKYVEVEKIVEVDRNPLPDSLALFDYNLYEAKYARYDNRSIYVYMVDYLFSIPEVDYIIMSYGKSTIYSDCSYGSPLPFNCVTFIGYNTADGMIKSKDEYGDYGCYIAWQQYPVGWRGATIDNSRKPYSWNAWKSGINPNFYNKDQYVVEIIYRD